MRFVQCLMACFITRPVQFVDDFFWLPGISHTDDEYTMTRKRLAVRFQFIHVFVAIFLELYLQLTYEFASTTFLPFRVFIACTGVMSVLSLLLYRKTRSLRGVYWSVAFYGLATPYILWTTQGGFMSNSMPFLPWSFASVVLILAMGDVLAARIAMGFHVFLPIFALGVERAGYRTGVGSHSFAGPLYASAAASALPWHLVVTWMLEGTAPYIGAFIILSHLVEMLQFSREAALLKQALSDRLLLNILPKPIAEQLMNQLSTTERPGCIVQSHSCVTVCFSDVCGFTSMCLEVSAETLVNTLNDIFTTFDMLCLQHGVEKIKTIGDAYMMVGFPKIDSVAESISEAAMNVIRVAIRMIQVIQRFQLSDTPLTLRVGAHSGPVVAGVIGNTKFCYDLWGPVVNLASRLESSGVRSRIQVSSETANLIHPQFQCTFRDVVPLKGAGSHRTFLVNMPVQSVLEATLPLPDIDPSIGLPNIAAITRLQGDHKKTLQIPSSRRNSLNSQNNNNGGARPSGLVHLLASMNALPHDPLECSDASGMSPTCFSIPAPSGSTNELISIGAINGALSDGGKGCGVGAEAVDSSGAITTMSIKNTPRRRTLIAFRSPAVEMPEAFDRQSIDSSQSVPTQALQTAFAVPAPSPDSNMTNLGASMASHLLPPPPRNPLLPQAPVNATQEPATHPRESLSMRTNTHPSRPGHSPPESENESASQSVARSPAQPRPTDSFSSSLVDNPSPKSGNRPPLNADMGEPSPSYLEEEMGGSVVGSFRSAAYTPSSNPQQTATNLF